MFTLKIIAGSGGADAEAFASELSGFVAKTTGVTARGNAFRL
jgi:hypothetical protein